MADILTLVFKTLICQQAPKQEATVSPLTACSAVLVGEQSVSRSVLLLAAVTAASHLGIRVTFFSQTHIQSLPPALHRCVPSLSPDSLKKIRFSYPRTVEELLQQVASLHEPNNTSPMPPSLIIVDRMEGFLHGSRGGSLNEFHSGEQSCAAHISALLCDTAAFLTHVLEQRSSGAGPCRVIVSFQSDIETGQVSGASSVTDPFLETLDRYFPVRCTLDQDRGYEAAAAGLQELWHIYFSGSGITETLSAKDSEDRLNEAQEWQLLIFPDGLMEFKPV